MNILNRIKNMVKTSLKDIEQSVTGDADSDVETIGDLNSQLADAVESLAAVTKLKNSLHSELTVTKHRTDEISRQLQQLEARAIHLLNNGDESKALNVAQEISQLNASSEQVVSLLAQQSTNMVLLEKQQKHAQKLLVELRRDVDMVNTTATVQETTDLLRSHLSDGQSSLTNAKETLEKIKQKQLMKDDYDQALSSLNEDDNLEQKFREAGLSTDKNDPANILKTIKEKQHGKS